MELKKTDKETKLHLGSYQPCVVVVVGTAETVVVVDVALVVWGRGDVRVLGPHGASASAEHWGHGEPAGIVLKQK